MQLRSRQYPDLTNYEIEEYLKQNDIIIVPVGHCETLGSTPVDGEYVMAHAWANLIAERVDGIVLPNVTYTYAGGTETGRGTIHMNPVDSFRFTLALAKSLLRQGFRRQLWIPAHGPTKSFLPGMVQQLFIETKVPELYLDVQYFLEMAGALKPMDFRKVPEPIKTKDGKVLDMADKQLGAYKITGRLGIYPAKGEVDFPVVEGSTGNMFENMAPWYKDEDAKRCFETTDIVSTPIFFEETSQHGGNPMTRFTRKELEEHAALGEQYLNEVADEADFPQLLRGLRKVDRYMWNSAVPKNADHLPMNYYSPAYAEPNRLDS